MDYGSISTCVKYCMGESVCYGMAFDTPYNAARREEQILLAHIVLRQLAANRAVRPRSIYLVKMKTMLRYLEVS